MPGFLPHQQLTLVTEEEDERVADPGMEEAATYDGMVSAS